MAKKKATGLGRLGIDALLSTKVSTKATTSSTKEFAHVGIECIRPNPQQPRMHIVKEALDELADSIKVQGLIQPLLVRPLSQAGQYELIAGERRWRAAQQIGLETIPVVIRDVPDQQSAILALVENIQRTDLTPLEEAQALQKTLQTFNFTHEEMAAMVGRSRPAVSNLIRLLELDEAVKALLDKKKIEEGHARLLLRLAKDQQLAAANTIVADGMTVRKTEDYIARLLSKGDQNDGERKAGRGKKSADIMNLEGSLQDKLGTQVNIQHRKSGKGQIVIHYASLDILDGILEKIH